MSNRIEYPLVSLGVPVYNEARFIDASLASLRNQDYPNLEIVIVDNASTDRTLEICERHAEQDPRIRIERAAENRGATANFQRALELANGEYFMWASGHDLWSSNLVSECATLLRSTPSACIAFASSRWIDAHGEPLARASGWTDTRGMLPAARLMTIFWGNMHPVLGVMRLAQLRACAPMRSMTGADLVLLCELALRGDFVHASAATWSRREFRIETRYEDKLQRYASSSTGITRSRWQRMFPLLQLPVALLRLTWKSGLPLAERLMALLVLGASLPLRYRVGKRANAR